MLTLRLPNPHSPHFQILSDLAIGHGKQHIRMTWSAGFAPANEILAFQFPANIINGERKRSGHQISSIMCHGFFRDMLTSSDLVRISPFRWSANVDSINRLPPAS
jgi:hypothetical protein